MILVPQFGAGSADRHRLTSHEIAAGPSLRADVDTVEDLAAAQALGIGPRTATILGAATNPEPLANGDIDSSSSQGMMSP
jgi:2-phospho-L-lactate guanylyltransferase